jgi:hypothetical protein
MTLAADSERKLSDAQVARPAARFTRAGSAVLWSPRLTWGDGVAFR